MSFQAIEGGSVTSPSGFVAGAVCAGMYAGGPKKDQFDLGILFRTVAALVQQRGAY